MPMGRDYKIMKLLPFLLFPAVLLIAGCGPGAQRPAEKSGLDAAEMSISSAPEYDSVGVLASVEGQLLTLDHEGASGSGLGAGRQMFQAYADVLAEAPLEPGARATFRFRKAGEGYELVALKAR